MRKYLNPSTIARLANLQLVARMVVEGAVSGQHKSPYYGFNIEFSDHREYMPGDELRHVDWKLYAKCDRYYVKQYEESTNLRCYLLLDTSDSMRFGEAPMSKLHYGKCLVAALSYLMLHQQDSVGVATFSSAVHRVVHPRSTPAHLHRILECIDEAPGGGKTALFDILKGLAQQVKRRALVIIVSDFLDDPEALMRGVKYLKFLKHEPLLMQVMAPEEIDFPYDHLSRFVDMEDSSALVLDPRVFAAEYRDLVSSYLSDLAQECRFHRIDYGLFRTDSPLEDALGAFIGSRARRRK